VSLSLRCISASLRPNPAQPAHPALQTARKITLNYRCGSAVRMLLHRRRGAATEAQNGGARVHTRSARARTCARGRVRSARRRRAARCCRYRCRALSECNDVDGQHAIGPHRKAVSRTPPSRSLPLPSSSCRERARAFPRSASAIEAEDARKTSESE